MRLIYIANARIPTEKAHGVHIMKMCEAFSDSGVDIELWVPLRRNRLKRDPYEYYNVRNNFRIRKILSVDAIFLGKIGYIVQSISFGVFSYIYLLLKERGVKVAVYTRGESLLVWGPLPKDKVLFWETHIKPKAFGRYRKLLQKASGIITVTQYYRDELEMLGVDENRLLCSPDGVDVDMFDVDISKEHARKEMALPLDKKIVMYVGSDIDWKGLSVLKRASERLPDSFAVVLIGPGDTKRGNIISFSAQPYKDIPVYLKASDVLVLTGTEKSEISKFYTSPLKMFEYMASGRPIVAANTPSIQEILDDQTAVLVEADDPGVFRNAIVKVVSDTALSTSLSVNALKRVMHYTWGARAAKIVDFIKKTVDFYEDTARI